MKKIYLIALVLGLYSCFSHKYKYKGEKEVVNQENWKVKIYQFDEFEMITPIKYEIVDLISERQRLSADSNLQNLNNFYIKMHDSILYICHPYPKIVAIKHMDSLNRPNQWDLIKKLKKYDTLLYNNQNNIFDNY